MKVVCPQCKRRLFETTEKYNPDISPNGSMVRFLGGYHIDWLTTSATKCSELACPECQGQLAPSGRLTVIEEKEITPKVGKPVYICDICGKECSTALALNGHMRSHKNKSEAQQ
jgi:uncharacterized protein YbaR (Trm112 family)